MHTIATRWRDRNSSNTVRLKTAALRRALRAFAATTGTPDLSYDVPKAPAYRQRNIIAQPDELARLYAAAEPIERIWLRLTTAFALGQAEATALSAANYDPEKRTITFVRKKTGEPNTLPVPDDLQQIFEHAPDTGDPTIPFLTRWNRKPLTYAAIIRRWQRLKKRARVRREITPHDLRRTTATALYELTKDLRVVQQLLGHQSLHATVMYVANKNPEALRPLLAQLWKPQTELKQ